MSVFNNIISGQKILGEEQRGSMLIGKIEFKVGGEILTADLLLPETAPEHATAICGSIYHDGTLAWKYQANRPADFDGRAHLIELDGVALIAYVDREQRLTAIETIDSVVFGQSTGIKAAVTLKYAAAAHLCLAEVVLTANEGKVSSRLDAERAERAKAELHVRRAENERQKQERAAAREEKRKQILGRQQLKLQDSSGRRLFGIPVIGDEWQCLADGTWVVVVSAHHEGVVGELLEHGVVSKKGGKPQLKSVTPDLRFAQTKVIKAPEPVGTILLEINDDVHEVSLFRFSDLAALKESGSLGTFAARNGAKLIVGRIVRHNEQIKMIELKAKEFA